MASVFDALDQLDQQHAAPQQAIPANAPPQQAQAQPPQQQSPVFDALDSLDKHWDDPGVIQSFGQAAIKGIGSAVSQIGQTAQVVGGRAGDAAAAAKAAPVDKSKVGQLAQQPLDWTNPSSIAAHAGYGLGQSSPTLAGAVVGAGIGGAAGSVEPGGGNLVGGAIGGALGGAIPAAVQKLGPAYIQGINEGLSPEDATARALKETGIDALTSGAASAIPGFSFLGRTAEGALKKPLTELMIQTFGVQPAVSMAGSAANRAVEGKSASASELAQEYFENALNGAVMTAGHHAITGAYGAAKQAVKPSIEAVPEKGGSQEEQAALNGKPAVPAGVFVINDGAIGEQPAGPLHGQIAVLAPNQDGVKPGAKRVYLADGQEHILGEKLLAEPTPEQLAAAKPKQDNGLAADQQQALAGQPVTGDSTAPSAAAEASAALDAAQGKKVGPKGADVVTKSKGKKAAPPPAAEEPPAQPAPNAPPEAATVTPEATAPVEQAAPAAPVEAPATPAAPAAEEEMAGPAPDTTPKPIPQNTASVPFMITKKMRADLKARGITDEQIKALKPAEAQDILAKPVESSAVASPAEQAPAAAAPAVPPGPVPDFNRDILQPMIGSDPTKLKVDDAMEAIHDVAGPGKFWKDLSPEEKTAVYERLKDQYDRLQRAMAEEPVAASEPTPAPSTEEPVAAAPKAEEPAATPAEKAKRTSKSRSKKEAAPAPVEEPASAAPEQTSAPAEGAAPAPQTEAPKTEAPKTEAPVAEPPATEKATASGGRILPDVSKEGTKRAAEIDEAEQKRLDKNMWWSDATRKAEEERQGKVDAGEKETAPKGKNWGKEVARRRHNNTEAEKLALVHTPDASEERFAVDSNAQQVVVDRAKRIADDAKKAMQADKKGRFLPERAPKNSDKAETKEEGARWSAHSWLVSEAMRLAAKEKPTVSDVQRFKVAEEMLRAGQVDAYLNNRRGEHASPSAAPADENRLTTSATGPQGNTPVAADSLRAMGEELSPEQKLIREQEEALAKANEEEARRREPPTKEETEAEAERRRAARKAEGYEPVERPAQKFERVSAEDIRKGWMSPAERAKAVAKAREGLKPRERQPLSSLFGFFKGKGKAAEPEPERTEPTLSGKFIPLDSRPIDEAARDFTNGHEAAQWIAENSQDPAYRAIAARIIPALEDAHFHMAQPGERFPSEIAYHLNNTSNAVYVPGKGPAGEEQRSLIVNPGRNEETILHELIHQATASRLWEGEADYRAGKNTELAQHFEKFLNLKNEVVREYNRRLREAQAKNDTAAIEELGETQLRAMMSSVHEMAAYTFTNERIRDFMRSIKTKDPAAPTLWSKFVETVRGLFGIAPNEHNAFARLLELSDKLMDATEPYKTVPKDIRTTDAAGKPLPQAKASPVEESTARFKKEGLSDENAANLAKFVHTQFGENPPKAVVDALLANAKMAEAPAAPATAASNPAPQPPAGLGPKAKESWLARKKEEFITNQVSLFHGMEKIGQTFADMMGRGLRDNEDMAANARLAGPRAGANIRKAMAIRNETLDIVKDAGKLGMSRSDIAEALLAAGAKVRNAKIKAKDIESEHGSGMTDKEAEDILAKYNAEPKKRAVIDKLLKQMDKLEDLKFGIDSDRQIISADTIAKLKAEGRYIPYKGHADEAFQKAAGLSARDNLSVFGDMLGRAEGREHGSMADDPIDAMFRSVVSMAFAEAKNRYTLSVANAVRAANDASGGGLNDVIRVANSVADHDVGGALGAVGRKNVIAFREDGQTKYLVIKDGEMAQKLLRMKADEVPKFLKNIGSVVNFEKAFWTHYSPDFLAKHFLGRFPLEGLVNLSATKDKTGGKLEIKPLQYMKNIYSRAPDMFRYLTQGADAVKNADNRDLFKRMDEAGGIVGSSFGKDAFDMKAALEDAIANPDKRPALYKRLGKWFDMASSAVDNAQRAEHYRLAEGAGMSPMRAALEGRDATVDFDLQGQQVKTTQVFFPFASTAFKTTRGIIERAATSKSYRRTLAGLTVGMMALDTLNYMIAGQDDDGTPLYDKVPSYVRNTSAVFMLPSTGGSKTPNYIAIPLPYTLYWMKALTNGGSSMLMHHAGMSKIDTKESLLHIATGLAESFTPAGHEFENPKLMMVPEPMRPIMAIWGLNEDAQGRHIHTEHPKAGIPKADQGYSTTGEGYKSLAQMLGKVGIDNYPEDYRYIANQIFGGQIRPAQRLGEAAQDVSKGNLGSAAMKLPGVSSLANSFGGQVDPARANANRFSQITDKAQVAPIVLTAIHKRDAGEALSQSQVALIKSAERTTGYTAPQLAEIAKTVSDLRRMYKGGNAPSNEQRANFLAQTMKRWNAMGIEGGFE